MNKRNLYLIRSLFRYDGFSKFHLRYKYRILRQIFQPHYTRYLYCIESQLTNHYTCPIESFGIHRIKIRKRSVTIYTSRPGFIIGRQGDNFRKLEDSLSLTAGYPVKLYLKEYNPFEC